MLTYIHIHLSLNFLTSNQSTKYVRPGISIRRICFFMCCVISSTIVMYMQMFYFTVLLAFKQRFHKYFRKETESDACQIVIISSRLKCYQYTLVFVPSLMKFASQGKLRLNMCSSKP
jgi:hypothetical protein